MKNIFCFLIVCSFGTWVFSPIVYSQTTITLGSGTSETATTDASPVNNYYKSARLQIVYTAQELWDAGWTAGTPGDISQLGVYVTQVPDNALPNYTIKIKTTTASDAASHDAGSLTQVYTTTSYSPTAGGFDMITFDSDFDWDGLSNILVDICWDLSTNWSSTGKVRYYSVTNGMRYVRSDASSQCGTSTANASTKKPQVQLVITANSTAPANDNICNATAITIDADGTLGTNVNGSLEATDDIGDCWVENSKSHTVWYSFVGPSDGSVNISIEYISYASLSDPQVAIFSSSDNTCTGTLTEIGCDDDSGTPGCSDCPYKELTGLTSGDTYYIEIDGDANATGSFYVSVESAYVSWDGSTGNWTTASSWSSGAVPTSATNVKISAGTVTIPNKKTGGATKECRNILIESGVTLKVETATKNNENMTFKMHGNVTNNGTIEHNGNIYMNVNGENKTLSGTGTYTSTSGAGPGYLLGSSSNVTLTNNISSFNYFRVDGTVNIQSNTVQTTNIIISSGATFNQNSGTLEFTETTPDFSGTFNAGTGTTYYNVTSGGYIIDDADEFYHLKVTTNGSGDASFTNATTTMQNLNMFPLML